MADDNVSDFTRSMGIATSGLRAQAGRMRVISENIANADSTASTAGGNPYRRKVPTFVNQLDRVLDAKTVSLGKIKPDQSDCRDDRHARRPALLRGQSQHHQRDAPDDPAHPRYPQGLNMMKFGRTGPASKIHLSHRERSDCIVRCNPGEGLKSLDSSPPHPNCFAIRPLPAGER